MSKLITVPFFVTTLLLMEMSLHAMERLSFLLLGFLAFLFAAFVTSCLGALSFRQSSRPYPPAVWLVIGVCAAVSLSILLTQWPFRAAYALSRPAMEQTALALKEGKSLQCPCRVGCFLIRKAEVTSKGVACLWTDLDTAGRTGFVQCSPRTVPFNIWSLQVLDDRWQLITED